MRPFGHRLSNPRRLSEKVTSPNPVLTGRLIRSFDGAFQDRSGKRSSLPHGIHSLHLLRHTLPSHRRAQAALWPKEAIHGREAPSSAAVPNDIASSPDKFRQPRCAILLVAIRLAHLEEMTTKFRHRPVALLFDRRQSAPRGGRSLSMRSLEHADARL